MTGLDKDALDEHITSIPDEDDVYYAKENPWLKPSPRDMTDIKNEIKLWLAQDKRNIININNGLDVTKYEEYNYEEARMIFENILKEESK